MRSNSGRPPLVRIGYTVQVAEDWIDHPELGPIPILTPEQFEDLRDWDLNERAWEAAEEAEYQAGYGWGV